MIYGYGIMPTLELWHNTNNLCASATYYVLQVQ